MAWRLARALDTLRDEVLAKFPSTTIWTVGDADHASRPSDHNPDDHDDDASTPGVVSAIDVVGFEQAKMLRDHLQSTRDPRVEYWIFNGEWGGSDHGWQVRNYSGSNQHRSHCHVSVGRGSDSNLTRPDLFDDPSPWGFSAVTIDKDDDMFCAKGDDNEKVRALQYLILEAGGELPVYGADADYGTETAEGLASIVGGNGETYGPKEYAKLMAALGGEGAVGPQGPQGPKGEKGDRGPAGPAGPKGDPADADHDHTITLNLA